MRRSLVTLGIVGLLSGCAAAATSGRYDKAGVSTEERQQDESACVQASIGGRNGRGGAAFVPIDRDAYRSCMAARGYTLTTAQ